MKDGSMNHFFSGMGRGIGLTRHGTASMPATFRPITAPTSVSGRITNNQMAAMISMVVKGMAPEAL